MDIAKRLEKRLLPEAVEHEELLHSAEELLNQVTEMEKSLENSRLQLTNLIERLNADLGTAIRQRQPKMKISHHNGTCSCGYLSRDINCKPDFQKKIWVVDGRLGRGFNKRYPQALHLGGGVGNFADAIVNYFKQYYRTLS